MKSIRFRILQVLCGFALPCLLVTAQESPLAPVVQADLKPGSSAAYRVRAKAGDLVSGPITVGQSGSLKFEAYDPLEKKLKAAVIGSGETRIGFVAPVSGTYRVKFSAWDETATSFSWKVNVESPERMKGMRLTPIISYESPRISRLAKEIGSGVPNALRQFWAEAAAAGGPIVEALPTTRATATDQGTSGMAEEVLVTFLWREIYDTYSVEVIRPPSGPTDYRLMTHLKGTDVWYKTMKVHRTTRLLYSLAPNRRGFDKDGAVTQLLDPLNPRKFPEAQDQWIARSEIENDPAAAWASVFSLPDAPDESWVRRTPPRRGELIERSFDSPILKARLSLHIYTPPGYGVSNGPYPLVLLFDGPAFATGIIAAPTTLDNLIADGRIRAPIAVFVASTTDVVRNRGSNLSNPAFGDAVATELIRWLRSSYPISLDPRDFIIGGSSAGAVAAGRAALRHPDVFGNVLAMSGGAAASDLFITTPRVSIRFYIDIGLYELADNLPFDEQSLTESQTVRNRRFRDILLAKGYDVMYRETGGDHSFHHWRATLAEGLMALLRPDR